MLRAWACRLVAKHVSFTCNWWGDAAFYNHDTIELIQKHVLHVNCSLNFHNSSSPPQNGIITLCATCYADITLHQAASVTEELLI